MAATKCRSETSELLTSELCIHHCIRRNGGSGSCLAAQRLDLARAGEARVCVVKLNYANKTNKTGAFSSALQVRREEAHNAASAAGGPTAGAANRELPSPALVLLEGEAVRLGGGAV